jgi:hypothetical protein
MSKTKPKKDPRSSDYGFEDLFIRERDDGDLDFLFSPGEGDLPKGNLPKVKLSERRRAKRKPSKNPKPALTLENFDLSGFGGKSLAKADKFYDQGDGEALYVVVGGADGLIANIEASANDLSQDNTAATAAQRDSWRDLVKTIVFGLLGLWVRSGPPVKRDRN